VVLQLFPFDPSLAFFSLLAAVAHIDLLLDSQSQTKLPIAPETLPSVPPPEKPQVPNEVPPVTPPVTDPRPDPKADPTAIDPDDAQIETPKDDVFKKGW
jgi:hypothetical protein